MTRKNIMQLVIYSFPGFRLGELPLIREFASQVLTIEASMFNALSLNDVFNKLRQISPPATPKIKLVIVSLKCLNSMLLEMFV